MLTVTLYTRKDCHLCEQAKADLESLQQQYPHRLVEIDIDQDPTLQKAYLAEIPVVEVGPYVLKAPFDKQKLAMTLGATLPANIIYTIYKPLCHQFGFRSFFLFGEQPYYPLKEAKVPNVLTFDQITGFQDLGNPMAYARLQARQFTGNDVVGYKMALCERDIAIYSGMFLFGLVYSLTKRRLKPLHWILWVLIGMGPIGLDGFSQLFSQMNWSFLAAILPYRESTPFLRVFTGLLFGFTTAWFAYPYMEVSFNETRQLFIKKFAAINKINPQPQ